MTTKHYNGIELPLEEQIIASKKDGEYLESEQASQPSEVDNNIVDSQPVSETGSLQFDSLQ